MSDAHHLSDPSGLNPPTARTVTLEPWPHDAVALVPMRNLVLFPHALTPVAVGREASLRAVQEALARQRVAGDGQVLVPLGFVLQKQAQTDAPGPDDVCTVGTLVRVLRDSGGEPAGEGQGSAAGQRQMLCLGLSRFQVRQWLLTQPFLLARVEPMPDEAAGEAAGAPAEAAALRLRERAAELLQMLPGAPAELVHALQATRSPAPLGDVVAGLLDAEPAQKQQWLEMTDTAQRLEEILRRVEHRIEILRLSQEIGLRTREQLQDRERRALLREQLQAIRKELGEEDSAAREVARLREALRGAGVMDGRTAEASPEGGSEISSEVPPEVSSEVEQELGRLSHLPEASSEHALLRAWLQTVSELPWKRAAREAQPVSQVLRRAREVLDTDHEGLVRIKRELLEHLAVRQLQPSAPAPILCFVGPPGVGKTSLGQSIARALDRPFGRVSLGGVHDESEIRGHRRTYIGAMPGIILQTLRRCGSRDAVLMLDEIDKLARSGHGDPTAAMLEVLDPAQHHAFRDHYLGLPFDLSAVMFIATANVLESIPAPLRDRLDVIELSGYTTEDKLRIARRHLLPRQRQACGLAQGRAEMDDALIEQVIEGYTREAGVRQLERSLGRLMRHAAWRGAQEGVAPVGFTAEEVAEVLGVPKVPREQGLRHDLTGVATGLAWTPVGGDVLFIEASGSEGSGKLLLTGQLGEVMRESAQAALSLLKSGSVRPEAHQGMTQTQPIHPAQAWPVSPAAFGQRDVHVHVPAGAIPKDGPSAGVAIFAALASLFSGRPVRHDVAMTGEISLRGLVLPVGGIREKVLAAARAGVRHVILPMGNRPDWAEVPASARERLEVHWAETAQEVLQWSLVPGTAPQ